MLRYGVISDPDLGEVISGVNEIVAEGREPHGPLVHAMGSWHQAIFAKPLVVEYLVVSVTSEFDAQPLNHMVQMKILDGWQPLGPCQVADGQYVQTLVRYDD